LARENIRDYSGGGACGAKMQGASVALAEPNGLAGAYRVIRAVRAVPFGQRFSPNVVEVGLVLH
jgi:hypothetical protein